MRASAPISSTRRKRCSRRSAYRRQRRFRLFYRQVTLHRGLPFDVKLPNEETRETMQLALVGEDLVEYTGLDELKATFGPAHAPDHDETI